MMPFFLAQADPAGSPLGSFVIPLLAMLAIWFFLVIRPQNQEQKRHGDLLATLKKGDEVVTISGMHGKVFEVHDQTVVLEVADKVRVTVDKPVVKFRKDDPRPTLSRQGAAAPAKAADKAEAKG